MIVKLEDITIDQLGQLFQFLESDTNRKACLLSWNPVAGKDEPTPFTQIMDCKAYSPPGAEKEGQLPSFNLTLKIEEKTRVVDAKKDEPSLVPTPLALLAKLMQSLDLFPEF
jgi:hypothetical protein